MEQTLYVYVVCIFMKTSIRLLYSMHIDLSMNESTQLALQSRAFIMEQTLWTNIICLCGLYIHENINNITLQYAYWFVHEWIHTVGATLERIHNGANIICLCGLHIHENINKITLQYAYWYVHEWIHTGAAPLELLHFVHQNENFSSEKVIMWFAYSWKHQ